MGNTARQGDLAEAGFLYRATEGFTVGRPFGGDVRYDAMLEGGAKVRRVRVKSTMRLCRKNVYEVRIGRQVERGWVGPKVVGGLHGGGYRFYWRCSRCRRGPGTSFRLEELRGRTRLNLHAAQHQAGGPECGCAGEVGFVSRGLECRTRL